MSAKVILPESEMPTKWYNNLPDLPKPLDPPLNPQTNEPISPDDLAVIFPMGLIAQEMSTDQYIDIPQEVLDLYSMYRPTPLYRAKRLEEFLDTPAKIYYKYEGVSPAGSHKPNIAIAQAYYNKEEGIKKLATETGAGQWGSALALATKMFGMDCLVYMVRVSYEQKPYRRIMMETWGADVLSSPTEKTNAGKDILEKDPDSLGSLGIAISEAVETAATNEDTNYALGSVLNHVLLHQTIIGEECQKQMEMAGDYPDVVIGCCGGGSNLGGVSFPFLKDKLSGKKDVRVIAAEPKACPTLTKGEYRYDYGDTAGMAPQVKMYTLGHDFVPAGIHAGGLRYHGDSPIISSLYEQGIIEATAYHQSQIFKDAIDFAQTEGIIVAPEAAHALSAVVEEAKKAKDNKEEKTILFNLSGHGHFDLSAYEAYLSGNIKDFDYKG